MPELSTLSPADLEVYWDAKRELYRRDFELYAREQLVITSTTPGQFLKLHPFTTPQRILHRVCEEQRHEVGYIRVVGIKGRQFGWSTYAIGTAFHLASLNSAVETLHLACDDDTVSSIFTKAKLMYDRLSEEVRPLSRYDSKRQLRFENPDARTRNIFPGLASGMRIAHAKNILAGTGTTGHFLHLSEASKYNSDVCALLETSIFPSLHLKPGTVCINESTAYHQGSYFRGLCEMAMSDHSYWRFCFVPWYAMEPYQQPLDRGERFRLTKEERAVQKQAERGLEYGRYVYPPQTITPEQFKWRRVIIASHTDGENYFKQEYPATFEEAWITYDINVFDRIKMYEAQAHVKPPLRFVHITRDGRMLDDSTQMMATEKSYFAIWEEPLASEKYDLGLDTSAGLEGGDFCVAQVFKRRNHEQVAEYRVRVDAVDLAEKVFWIGKFYGTAQIALEMANTGFAVNGHLGRLGYPYLYIWRHRERAYPTLSTYSGWKTTYESKSYLVSVFTSFLNRDNLIIHSRILWNEMFNYVKEPGGSEFHDRYMAAGGGYDDCVMAAGIALVAGDDEQFGRHSPVIEEQKSRRQMIDEALAKGGPAFSDDGPTASDNFLDSQKNFIRGFE